MITAGGTINPCNPYNLWVNKKTENSPTPAIEQIAQRLDISDHTAKFHVNGILGKLGAATRTEAVVLAVRLGLVAL